jgi:hypothetical protein
MLPLARFLALPTAPLAAGGVLAVSPPADAFTSASTTLCTLHTRLVGGGAYSVENDEWAQTPRVHQHWRFH